MRASPSAVRGPAPCPLSVVMPAYNEEDSIEAAVDEVLQCILRAVPGSELWVVDDGSRDRTAEIVDRLAAREANLHVLRQANRGHGAALLAGLERARGEWILMVDSDRQIPLDGFARTWERRGGLDALFGRRTSREDPLPRKVVSACLRLQVRLLFGARLSDPNAPYKLISRGLWEEARAVIPDNCLIPSVFLAVYAHRTGRQYAGVDVAYRKRAAGTTSLRKLKLLKFSARSTAQLVAFRGVRPRREPIPNFSELASPVVKKP